MKYTKWNRLLKIFNILISWFSLSRYKPLRRRVIWLIGQWISVKFKSDLRPMLYEAICNLLQDQDLVVCCLKVLKELSLTYVKVQIQKWFISFFRMLVAFQCCSYSLVSSLIWGKKVLWLFFALLITSKWKKI